MISKTRVAAVTIVKNESDILELFIKHNSDLIDQFYIIDHFSSDGTAEIIDKMKDAGFNVCRLAAKNRVFYQSKETTDVVNALGRGAEFDYIIPLDADEFLPPLEKRDFHHILRSHISPQQAGKMQWITYCPISDDYFERKFPLNSGFVTRSYEPQEYNKVVIGADLAKNCVLTEGNHGVRVLKRRVLLEDTGIALQHVPIRSAEQLIQKILVGTYTRMAKPNRNPKKGFHIFEMAATVRARNYQVDLALLQEAALFYSFPLSQRENVKRPELTNDFIQLKCEHSIEMPDLAGANMIAAFDHAICGILEEGFIVKRRGTIFNKIVGMLNRIN